MVMENERLSADKREFREKNFTPNGKFKKGNIIGRFPKVLTLTYLTNLIKKDERVHPDKVPLLKHYLERLRRSDILLAKFMDKYLPTLQELEVTIPKVVKEVVYIQGGKPPEEENDATTDDRKEK
jgi:hypothetical protein